MKKLPIYFGVFILFLGLSFIISLFNPLKSSAYIPCDGAGDYSCFPTQCRGVQLPGYVYDPNINDCLAAGVVFPPNTCNTSTWQFTYNVCVTAMSNAGYGQCVYSYDTRSITCNATDSCVAPEPYLKPGICSASSYDGVNPNSACVVGSGDYKTCCNSNGTTDGACWGGTYTGSCPTGTTTVICGVTSCSGISAPCTTAACGTSACLATFPQATATPTTPPTSAIRGYKVLMPNNQNAAPAQGQTVWLDGNYPTTDNPYGTGSQFAWPQWNSISAGSHAISVSFPNGYGLAYTSCENSTGCHNGSFQTPSYPETNKASQTVNAPSGGYNDLYWHFYPPPTASINIVGSTTRTVGEALTFNANANDGNGNLQTGEIYWSVSNTGNWNSLGTSAISGSTASFSKTWNTTGQPAGTYVVVVNEYSRYNGRCTGNTVTIPAGWVSCGPGGTSTSDSDVVVVTLTNPAPGTISGNLYIDNNGDCTVNGSDTGYSNWQVRLGGYGSKATNASGAYSFGSAEGVVVPSTRTVDLPSIPSGYTLASCNTQSRSISLTSVSPNSTNNNFFIVPNSTPTNIPTTTTAPNTYSIKGDVFIDTNGNGIKDTGEVNYVSSTNNLALRIGSCSAGTLVGERASVSISPGYSFPNLTNLQSYYLNFALPSGYTLTTPFIPGGPNCGANGRYFVTRTINGADINQHWGIQPTATTPPTPTNPPAPISSSIIGRVFVDNGVGGGTPDNGTQDGSEPGYSTASTIVSLRRYFGPGCFGGSTISAGNRGTNSFGDYSFTGLPQSTGYDMDFTMPAGYRCTTGACINSVCTPSSPGTITVNYGIVNDVNIFGRFVDSAAVPFPTSNGSVVRRVTINDGVSNKTINYSQCSILSNNYCNTYRNGTILLPTTYTITGSTTTPGYFILYCNSNVANCSVPANYTQGSTFTAPLLNGRDSADIWFMFTQTLPPTPTSIPLPSILTNVFVDTNRNGVQNVGEVGYSGGANLRLMDCVGSCTLLQNATTNASGQYTFANLTPDLYSVILDPVFGYTITTPTQRDITVPPNGTANFGIAPSVTIQGSFVDNNLNFLSTNIGQNVTIINGATNYTVVKTNQSYYNDDLPTANGYSVTAAVPAGYTVLSCISTMVVNGVTVLGNDCFTNVSSYQAVNPVTGINLPTQLDYATIWFMYYSSKTISGNVFLDNNKNGYKDGAETNYTGGGITITSGNGTVNVNQALGSYQITGLTQGTYFVSYAVIPADYSATFPKPTSYSATVGPGCTWSPNTIPPLGLPTGASCDAGNNILNLNFGITNSNPWIQSKGTDLRFDDGFTDHIPAVTGGSCPGGSSASVPPAGGSPGVIFSGDRNPDFGAGQASALGWKIGDPIFPELYIPPNPGTLSTSYESMMSKVNQAGLTPTIIANLSAGLTHGLYLVDGDLNIGSNYTFGAGQNYIILVNGNLFIGGNIDVPIGSTATFIVKGNQGSDPFNRGITISASVSQIEGYYSTDWNFFVASSSACILGPDIPLVIEGAVVVNAVTANGGQFVLERDLCAGNVCPAVTVITRPDFILNAPALLMKNNALRQEVAP